MHVHAHTHAHTHDALEKGGANTAHPEQHVHVRRAAYGRPDAPGASRSRSRSMSWPASTGGVPVHNSQPAPHIRPSSPFSRQPCDETAPTTSPARAILETPRIAPTAIGRQEVVRDAKQSQGQHGPTCGASAATQPRASAMAFLADSNSATSRSRVDTCMRSRTSRDRCSFASLAVCGHSHPCRDATASSASLNRRSSAFMP